MILSALNGFILGLSLCVPFGPINILILNNAVKSFKNGFLIGFAALLIDISYFSLCYFGFSFLNNEKFFVYLSYFSFCFLSYLAFLTFKSTSNIQKSVITNTAISSFLKGAFVNIFNPFVIIFWFSYTASIKKEEYMLIIVTFLFLAVFLWILFLAFFSAKYARILNQKVLKIINIISAFVLEFFAFKILLSTI